MKKILCDATALADQYKDRGIGNYARNVLARLVNAADFEWHILGFGKKEDYPYFSENVSFHSLGSVCLSTPANLLNFRLKFLPIIKNINPDLYFCLNFERGLPIGICKTAVTMHDIIPYKTRQYSSKGIIFNFLKGIFYRYNLERAKKAALVLTNSNFTKQELENIGFASDKIIPAYAGVDESFHDLNFSEEVKARIFKKHNITSPYLLYYGGLTPNKNVEKLLDAFALVIKSNADLRLVIVDKSLRKDGDKIIAESPDSERTKLKIERLKIASPEHSRRGDFVILPGFLRQDEIPVILKAAEIFVHLSNYEGFGLSVVEAMTVGTPTIAANRSCYPEVLGDGALLVDPDKPDEVAKEILNVLDDQIKRDELVIRGIEQAQKYSWDKTAEITLRAFKEILR